MRSIAQLKQDRAAAKLAKAALKATNGKGVTSGIGERLRSFSSPDSYWPALWALAGIAVGLACLAIFFMVNHNPEPVLKTVYGAFAAAVTAAVVGIVGLSAGKV